MSLGPSSYEEALELARQRPQKPRKPMNRGRGFRKASEYPNLGLQGATTSRTLRQGKSLSKGGLASGAAKALKRRTLKSKPDPKLAAWGLRVRGRDENLCQWPECRFCHNEPEVLVDPHHKALRSARPDLRLVDENGVTVCRRRHNWIHSEKGHEEAVERGFLNPRTMELARSEGTLGVR